MTFKQEENTIEVVRPTESKEDRTVHGTTRALNNMVQGVSQGFEKTRACWCRLPFKCKVVT